ncbi:thiolase family protein [Streptomyces rapamycinicus]|uniref:Probable acetyl-CoA acetyltransferase n=2 Tax=Streptomyces rapamycinicus TaxID=1226757 RepID=A0A0A0NEV7_STRRN|nr:thiolase family protein [Streptomyces rapamycinicus]AGP57997.1 acetyl-CoA acetyltransferase [Streptomyces rapamycinicus NRRL 5491]MBB4785669.1 acetyl-CoA acetyltransferase family protein [Streptomyces rapamycinicus]RLV78866.1 beta-ketoadipyl CoA thiolase [Streptomyces rapamycinicus NRRL 5491]UTO65835.1 thiolase family protein [Streptomyces rapamycinicus]UTP33790.1 thiolase family protein [Streptomyces rapamycinicus NRRL 5491]
MTALRDVYILDAVRTPIGKYGGALSGVRPDDLAAHVVRGLLARTPALDPARIDDVYFGNANGAGEENRDVARMAVLLAGLPVTVPGATVNRLCASGLEAVLQAARAIAVGDAHIALAGGVESMSRAPWVLPKPERAFPAGHQQMYSTTLGWRMTNPDMPPEWTVALGEGAELIADKHGITREAQDAFALTSHEKAARAWKDGAYEAEVLPYPDTGLVRDETIRENTSTEALAKLKPAFRKPGGTVTAGNASPLNDGAAALLLVDEEGLKATGREPLARIGASAVTGIEPQYFGLGPVEAVRRALAKAGRSFADLATLELNEAFAAQVLGCLAEWPDLNPDIVNPHGGAIAIGHPLGASGARLAGAVAHQLAARGSGTGLATLCIGVGQGLALVLER